MWKINNDQVFVDSAARSATKFRQLLRVSVTYIEVSMIVPFKILIDKYIKIFISLYAFNFLISCCYVHIITYFGRKNSATSLTNAKIWFGCNKPLTLRIHMQCCSVM
jgi:hypothetical protein